jgi:hypothetical protein
MEPRWIGIKGALATRSPSGANSAQEKSRRSLMLVLIEVCCNERPIASATLMKRLAKRVSRIGSGPLPGVIVFIDKSRVDIWIYAADIGRIPPLFRKFLNGVSNIGAKTTWKAGLTDGWICFLPGNVCNISGSVTWMLRSGRQNPVYHHSHNPTRS